MRKKVLVIDDKNQTITKLSEVMDWPEPVRSTIEFTFAPDEKELNGQLIKNLYAVILLYIPAERPETRLESANIIRFGLKELNARIIAVFDGKLVASIEKYITNYPIDGYISGNDLNKQNLRISLMLALRTYDRIRSIKDDYERSRLIKRFLQLPSQFNGIVHFIDAAYQKLLGDPHVKSVAVFHEASIIKCSGDRATFKRMFERWEKSNREIVGRYIFLQIREFENYVLAVESVSSSKEAGNKFSLDLMEHAGTVRENIIDLVKNDRLLLDLYFISTNSNRLVWVEAKGRKVNLHFGRNDVDPVNQQFKTISHFFGEDYLLQINRSILVNTGKIKKISSLSSRNLIIEMTTGDMFSVSRSNIKKIKALFKDRLE